MLYKSGIILDFGTVSITVLYNRNSHLHGMEDICHDVHLVVQNSMWSRYMSWSCAKLKYYVVKGEKRNKKFGVAVSEFDMALIGGNMR